MRGRGRGDLHVQIVVDTPAGLTKEQERLLREFAALRGEELASEEAASSPASARASVDRADARARADRGTDRDACDGPRPSCSSPTWTRLSCSRRTPTTSLDVLRLDDGDPVVAADGTGAFCPCRIAIARSAPAGDAAGCGRGRPGHRAAR